MLHIPPPIVMLVAGALMWALDRWMPLAHWIAAPWNWLAGPLAAGGVSIAIAALQRFRQAGTTVDPLDPEKASHLVTEGVFRVSRNPMYLGLLVLLIAWAVWLGSCTPWLVPPLFAILLTYVQIIPEERALSQRFGEQYLAYRRRVARWLGRRS